MTSKQKIVRAECKGTGMRIVSAKKLEKQERPLPLPLYVALALVLKNE